MAERCDNDDTRWIHEGFARGGHGVAAANDPMVHLRRRLTGRATPPTFYVAGATAGTSGTYAEQRRSSVS